MNLEKIHCVLHDEIIAFSKQASPLKKFSLSSWQDKFVLHKVAKLLSPCSVVVEVGTYLGAGSAIMAHANPNIEIHTYDIYDAGLYDKNQDWLLENSLGVGKARTLENVSKFVERYPNIHLHQVRNSEVIEFDRPIDLFIEDSSHREPQLTFSLFNWLPKIKVGGILMLHDFRPWESIDNKLLRHPPVERHVDLLSKDEKWKFLGPVTNEHFLKYDPKQPSSYAIFQRVL
jgi:hypothetical protein